MEAPVQAIGRGLLYCSSLPCVVRSGARIPISYSGFQYQITFQYSQGPSWAFIWCSRFVRRVRIDRSAQVPQNALQLILNSCSSIEDFETNEMNPGMPLIWPLASQSTLRHCCFADPHSLGSAPSNLSLSTNLQTLHIVSM